MLDPDETVGDVQATGRNCEPVSEMQHIGAVGVFEDLGNAEFELVLWRIDNQPTRFVRQ
ncbi:MAG: hypothetical protein ACFHWZ_10485 [Phycisphaerales bacterium]